MHSNQQNENKKDQTQIQVQQIEQQYSCLEGRLFITPQWKKYILTFCIIQIPIILHEILHTQWFVYEHQYIALIFLFTLHFLNFWTQLALCFQDPGFIPKIKYQYQTDIYFMKIPKNQHITSHEEVSCPIIRKQQIQSLKLCSICNIYKPSRTSHCDQCGACVQRFDHHYTYLGVCIGKKNYIQFYIFLLSLLFLKITIIIMCIMILVGSEEDDPKLAKRLEIYPLSIIFVLLYSLSLIYVSRLVILYTYLLSKDQTYKQYSEEQWNKKLGNPDKKMNCLKNFFQVLCSTKIFNKNYRKYVYRTQNYQPSSSDPQNERKYPHEHSLSKLNIFQSNKNQKVIQEDQFKADQNNINSGNI